MELYISAGLFKEQNGREMYYYTVFLCIVVLTGGFRFAVNFNSAVDAYSSYPFSKI